MPQKIHPSNTNNRPAVGRISCLTEPAARPIHAEPVQIARANISFPDPVGPSMSTVLWLSAISGITAVQDNLFAALRP
jgi:hypothetical protein